MGYRTILAALLLTITTACSSSRHGAVDYKIAIVEAGAGRHGIFSMNADTSGGRLLIPDYSPQLRRSSWSPDGKSIAFLSFRPADSDIKQNYRLLSHFPLYVMNTGGGSLKRLLDFPISNFSWSPDSRKLIFISAHEDPQRDDIEVVQGKRQPLSAVYVLDVGTGEHRRLTSYGRNCTASWSPDSSRVALSLGDDESTALYSVSLDGQHIRRLVDTPGINMQPAWSPDGRTIAYVASSGPDTGSENSGIYTVQADGSNRRQLCSLPAYEVEWSPDGKNLLLLASDGIYVAGVDSGQPVRLTLPTERALEGAYTPDGRGVIFRSDREGGWYLYAINLQDQKTRRITEELSASSFCLSPLLR